MNPRTIAACVLAVAVIAVTVMTAVGIARNQLDDSTTVGAFSVRKPTTGQTTAERRQQDSLPANAIEPESSSAQRNESAITQDVDMNAPEVVEYQRFEAFRSKTREYFANATNTPQPQRSNLAVDLLRSIEWAEAEDYLLPVEALTLKLGLLQTTVTDEAVFKEVALDLAKSYKEKAKALEASRVPDPRAARYEVAQARIVEEVLASTREMDATHRQQLLRERLTHLRTEIYTTPPASSDESATN